MPATNGQFAYSSHLKLGFWSTADNWKYWARHSVTKWHAAGLLVNLIAFGIYVGALITVWEWRRRARKRWFQLSLLDFIFLATVVGGLIGSAFAEIEYGKRQLEMSWEYASNVTMSAKTQYRPPVFLTRLLNEDADRDNSDRWIPYGAFERIHSLAFYRVKPAELNRVLQSRQFRHVRSLEVIADEDYMSNVDVSLERLAVRCPLVHSLDVDAGRGSLIRTLDFLPKFSNLQYLDLDRFDLEHIDPPPMEDLLGLKLKRSYHVETLETWFGTMKKLKFLWLEDKESLDCLALIPPSVEELRLSFGSANEADLSGLAHLVNLRHLSLYKTRGKTVITSMPDLPRIESFEPLGIEFSDDVPRKWRVLSTYHD